MATSTLSSVGFSSSNVSISSAISSCTYTLNHVILFIAIHLNCGIDTNYYCKQQIHTYIRTYTHTYIRTYIHCSSMNLRQFFKKFLSGAYTGTNYYAKTGLGKFAVREISLAMHARVANPKGHQESL